MVEPAESHDYSSSDSETTIESLAETSLFQQEVQRLYRLTIYGRWLCSGVLWLTIGLWSLWSLRNEMSLLHQYFTWAALRYGLAYNPLPAIGLGLCVGLTVAILIWQSRNLLWGLPDWLQQDLQEQVMRIRRQGRSHPLWKWVCQDPPVSS